MQNFTTLIPGDTVVALYNVPDLMEPCLGFYKGQEYQVVKIEGTRVDVANCVGVIDSFSVNDSSKDVKNNLWQWFRLKQPTLSEEF